MSDILSRHEKYQSMLTRLEAYQNAGVLLYLSGELLSARDIAYACTVKEDASYMCDFIPDSNGSLCEIRFDCISPRRYQKNFKKDYHRNNHRAVL